MKIDSLKQLEAVIKLCHKQGVTDIKIDGIELHMTPIIKTSKPKKYTEPMPITPTITPYMVSDKTPIIEEVSKIETDELTEEQLLYYSTNREETLISADAGISNISGYID